MPRRSWLWGFLQSLVRILMTALFDVKVYGTHNVPKRGGVLLLPNHQSFLDPMLVAMQLRRPVSFMAKIELFEGSRFFAWLIRSLHAFPVRQNTADVGAIKQAIARLGEGHMLNMYPEGSRSLDGEIGPILPGVALVVRRAGVPIVPVVIDGSFDAWPRGGRLVLGGKIRLMYGPPMNVQGLKAQEIISLIDRTLRQMLTQLRQGDPLPSGELHG